MRLLNLLSVYCRRFSVPFNYCHLKKRSVKLNWEVSLVCSISGILSGIYFAGIISPSKRFEPIQNFLTPVVMAEIEEKKNNARKTITLNFLADAVEVAAPAVVHVDVNSQHRSFRHGGNSASGSGFIVTEGGVVLTNAHVVGCASEVNVRISTGETHRGFVIDVDQETDLAAIKLENKANVKFPFLKLGLSEKVRAGEFVAALGSPLRLSNTVTAGIVSSLQRGSAELGMRKGMYYIQTDAAINVGNSGGPLINLDGEVIGINCITVQQAAGISFAIPSDIVAEFLDGAIKREKDFSKKTNRNEKFYIGITMLALSPEIADELQRRNPSWFGDIEGGILVTKVNRGSPSERCGLVAGDVILSINNKSVSSTREVYNEVRKGDTMLMKVRRGKDMVTLNVEPKITSRL